MFKNSIVLDRSKHAELTVSPVSDWLFARNEILVQVSFLETNEAAREYPLIFLKNQPMVFALLGTQHGINAYIDAAGRWTAGYIPARIRAYPFALAPIPNQPTAFALTADAQQLGSDGTKLFDGDQLSKGARQSLRLLEAMKKAEAPTKAAVAAIRDAGLLVDRSIQIKTPEGQASQLKGFQIVDKSKLDSCDDAAFLKLRDQGALPLIYAHLLSLSNLRFGPVARLLTKSPK